MSDLARFDISAPQFNRLSRDQKAQLYFDLLALARDVFAERAELVRLGDVAVKGVDHSYRNGVDYFSDDDKEGELVNVR